MACLSEERADLPPSAAVGSLVGDRMNPLERKLDAGKPHVQFDERDLETCAGSGRMRHRLRKERQPMGQDLHAARQISTLHGGMFYAHVKCQPCESSCRL